MFSCLRKHTHTFIDYRKVHLVAMNKNVVKGPYALVLTYKLEGGIVRGVTVPCKYIL